MKPLRAEDPHRWDPRRASRGGVHRNLHLFGLSAFAVAQPLFAKLGPAPAYFAAHGMTALEVVLFALALVLVPAGVLIALETLTGLAGRRVRWVVHLVLLAALAALIVLPPFGGLAPVGAYVLAAIAGVAFTVAYTRFRGVRSFASALALAPLLFVVAFLFTSPTAKVVAGDRDAAWQARDSFRPPVFFVQFDALPSLLLETRDRRIDARRFPNFAQLARDGVWYRNASNVHENTVFSVPSFVDGRYPRKGIKPVVQDHSPNLFTLLGPAYRFNVAEEATTLCPYEFCGAERETLGSMWDDTRVVFNQAVRPEAQRESLPPITGRWAGFESAARQTAYRTRKKTPEYVIRHLHSGRIGRYERWLSRVGRGGPRPELDYVHMFLPHEPREFMPNGQRYATPDAALEGPPAYDSEFLSHQEEQRTILQLGYTDRVVGQLLDKLNRLGIYDDALVVVVADHGESFKSKPGPAGPFVPGHLGYRRAVTRRNLADIGSIPMFIKYPKGHGPSGIDDRYVRSVDVLPTIAGLLRLELPRLDGRDLNDAAYRGHTDVRVATTYDGVVRMPITTWERERRRSLDARLARFGSGSRPLFAWGPNRALVGRPLSGFDVSDDPAARATVADAGRLRDIDPASPVCACQLAGRIEGADPVGLPLAVALNGRIVAVGEGFSARGAKRLNWSVMVPSGAFKHGPNEVRVFAVDSPRKLRALGRAR